jgi:integrase
MPLTDVACRTAACPPDKARLRLTDAGGLYLEVSPAGSKRWFWKYYFNGKEKRLALGRYADAQSPRVVMSLRDAREARDKAREEHRAGVDPVQRRRLDKLTRGVSAETTFAAVARELHAVKCSGWSKQYGERWIERMEKDLFPWIGGVPLKEITAPLLLQTLRRIESRGAHETAHTLRQTAGQVFRYGVATGRCDANPAPHLHGALRPIIVKHMAAVLEPAAAGSLLRAIWAYEGQPLTRAALQLSALTFQRPGNIREMEWHEIDFDTARWTIPATKMKRTVQGKESGRPHLVPLAPQALEILREVEPLTGHGRYVFTSSLSGARPMSENTLRAALRRLGYSNDDMTPHGFRAMARTIMVEQLNVHPDVIEAQLAHEKSGPLGAAYDRAEFVAQRRVMMDHWADYLEALRVSADASTSSASAAFRQSGVRSDKVSTGSPAMPGVIPRAGRSRR